MTFDPFANQGGAAAWDPAAAAASNEAADQLFAADDGEFEDDLDDGTATQPYYLTDLELPEEPGSPYEPDSADEPDSAEE